MGSLTIPNLEVALQQHRSAFDFALQNNYAIDSMIFAQLMNALLPNSNQIKIATVEQIIKANQNPHLIIKCDHCEHKIALTLDVLNKAQQPYILPKNTVLPKPDMSQISVQLNKESQVWSWVENYAILLENNISNLTWSKLRGYSE